MPNARGDATNGFKHLEKLIEDLSSSLQREMHGLQREMREGFDRIERVTSRPLRRDRFGYSCDRNP